MFDSLWRVGLRAAYLAQLAVHFVLRPRVDGSHVVVLVGERVLLVENSYRRALGFPAGRVRAGEPIEQAAVRELREEVGLVREPEALTYLGEAVVVHEYTEDHVHLFELLLDAVPNVTIDGREVVWAGFVALDELDPDALGPPARAWLRGDVRPAPGPPRAPGAGG